MKSHDYSLYQYKHMLNLVSLDVLQQPTVGKGHRELGNQKLTLQYTQGT